MKYALLYGMLIYCGCALFLIILHWFNCREMSYKKVKEYVDKYPHLRIKRISGSRYIAEPLPYKSYLVKMEQFKKKRKKINETKNRRYLQK